MGPLLSSSSSVFKSPEFAVFHLLYRVKVCGKQHRTLSQLFLKFIMAKKNTVLYYFLVSALYHADNVYEYVVAAVK